MEIKKRKGMEKKKKVVRITGTQEWASSTVNVQTGCENDCRYCYAKGMAVRFGRKTAANWKEPEIRQDDIEKDYKKLDGTIMFPSTHDITPRNLGACLIVLKKLLEVGTRVMIVSKPDPECIRVLCGELAAFKDQIVFRFTIGSASNAALKFWEPNAPTFEQRVESLQIAREHGFEVGVSSEPMMDNNIEAVVERVLPFVTDSMWIGMPNRLKSILSLCSEDAETMARADELMACFTEERIMGLYGKYKDNPKIKWKDSIKKVVGIAPATEAGLDV